MYPIPHDLILMAVLMGSILSNGGGAFDVLTEQNLHPLVHWSPINMIVAVAVPSPPPQQSPIFGHRASSQTVANLFDS
jgi:hypothetical protein